jgi:hypothetical protein
MKTNHIFALVFTTMLFSVVIGGFMGAELQHAHDISHWPKLPENALLITPNKDNDSLTLYDVQDSAGVWPELTLSETDSLIKSKLK